MRESKTRGKHINKGEELQEELLAPMCVSSTLPRVFSPVWNEGRVADGRLRTLGSVCSYTETLVSV